MSDQLERCPLTAAVDIIGGKWTLIVLYALSQQPRRFNELQRLAPGVSHKVLTETVRSLESHGLVVREVGESAVPCVRYSLSDYGATLRPIVDTVAAWGREHLDLQRTPRPAVRNTRARSA